MQITSQHFRNASGTKINCSQKPEENKLLRLYIIKFVILTNAKVDLIFMKGKHHWHFFFLVPDIYFRLFVRAHTRVQTVKILFPQGKENQPTIKTFFPLTDRL